MLIRQKIPSKAAFSISLLLISTAWIGLNLMAKTQAESTPEIPISSNSRQDQRDKAATIRARSKLAISRIKSTCRIAYKHQESGFVPAFALNRGEIYYQADGSLPNKADILCARSGDTAQYLGSSEMTWVEWGSISGESDRKTYLIHYEKLLEATKNDISPDVQTPEL